MVRGSLLNYIADENGLRNRDSKILFIAATNFYGAIDEAVKRQGRIDTHLLMDNPTEENGRSMLQTFFAKDNKVEPVSEMLIEQAYELIRDEKRKKIRAEKFGGFNEEDFSSRERNILMRQLEEESRPSGAELETLYKELKETAFRQKNADARKLTIDPNILERRFQNR